VEGTVEIKLVEVKTFKKILTCAKNVCPGNYEFTGGTNIIPSSKVGEPSTLVFEHKCSVCFDEQNFEQKFPELIVEEIST
jgi:hypothetical protein